MSRLLFQPARSNENSGKLLEILDQIWKRKKVVFVCETIKISVSYLLPVCEFRFPVKAIGASHDKTILGSCMFQFNLNQLWHFMTNFFSFECVFF